jgi:hypothetical protein
MRMPKPALSCAIITAVISVALLALGETTWGIVGFIASGLFWAAIYAMAAERR